MTTSISRRKLFGTAGALSLGIAGAAAPMIVHASTDVPPRDTNGNVTPVNGSISTEPNTLSAT